MSEAEVAGRSVDGVEVVQVALRRSELSGSSAVVDWTDTATRRASPRPRGGGRSQRGKREGD